MIHFNEHTLSNGLKVIHHTDNHSPIAVMNLLYNVGSKDEEPSKTGFAHLFEHLMFGGSKNVPSYDAPLQEVGGENNAFTSSDITNYYVTLPKSAIETAFWLESDRMNELAFTPKSLEVQKKVVVEEFKQNYLNQPYGDVYLLLKPLAYKNHPYQWPTIGKKIEHISEAQLSDVKDFFYKHYRPNNAILSIVGDFEFKKIIDLSEKWFGDIPQGEIKERTLPIEPPQTEKRILSVERKVPQDAIYIAFHMCSRTHKDYHTTDLISDILSTGESSRFYEELVLGRQMFSELNAYITGEIEPALFIVGGKLIPEVKMDDAEQAIWELLNQMCQVLVHENELEKVKNKVLTIDAYGKSSALNKAMGLAYASLLGDTNFINSEKEHYLKVCRQDILKVAKALFAETNSSTLYYNKVDHV